MRGTWLSLLAILVCTSSSLMCACKDDEDKDSGSDPSGGRSAGRDGGAANGGADAETPHDAGDDSSAGDAGRGGSGAGGSAGDGGSSGGGGHQAGTSGSSGTGGSPGRTGSSGFGGNPSVRPACGDIGDPSNNLVVTVNGVEHDFSDATARFQYLGEGYHTVTLQKAEVSVGLTLIETKDSDCPAVRALPSSDRRAPWVHVKSTADNVTRSYDPSLSGAAGTFTMIGYHIITSPHRTLDVAFSCDNCMLRTAGGEDGGSSSAAIHGEVHLVNETP